MTPERDTELKKKSVYLGGQKSVFTDGMYHSFKHANRDWYQRLIETIGWCYVRLAAFKEEVG